MIDAFDAFLKSNFFGNPYNAWHDGLEVQRLTKLEGEELAQAEAILLNNLPDSRAVVGLGEIRSQKALEPLRKLVAAQQQSATEAAVALTKIVGDTSGIHGIIQTLSNPQNFWSQRMDAAIALSSFRSAAAINALVAALEDLAPLVRHHATMSLLTIYGHVAANSLETPQIAIKIMREYERAAAVTELRQMVEDHPLEQQ